MWEVEFYEKSNGRCPTKDFLDSLSPRDLVFINRALERLEKYGRDLDRPHVGFLRDDIWELRVKTAHGQYRLLYFFFDGRKFVITHGFAKKTRRVPDAQIDRAIEYRQDYLGTQLKHK